MRSGPILILDQSTLYVTSLRYDGKLPADVHFQAYNSTLNISVTFLDKSNSTDELHAYWGENIYLKLISNVTVYDVKDINVWSKSSSRIYGNIVVPNGIKVPENTNVEEDVRVYNKIFLIFH